MAYETSELSIEVSTELSEPDQDVISGEFVLKPHDAFSEVEQAEILARRKLFLLATHGPDFELDIEFLPPEEITTATELTVRAYLGSKVRSSAMDEKQVGDTQQFLDGRAISDIGLRRHETSFAVSRGIGELETRTRALLKRTGKVGLSHLLAEPEPAQTQVVEQAKKPEEQEVAVLLSALTPPVASERSVPKQREKKPKPDNATFILGKVLSEIPTDLSAEEKTRMLETCFTIFAYTRLKGTHGSPEDQVARLKDFVGGMPLSEVAQKYNLKGTNYLYKVIDKLVIFVNDAFSEEEMTRFKDNRGDVDLTDILERLKPAIPEPRQPREPTQRRTPKEKTSKVVHDKFDDEGNIVVPPEEVTFDSGDLLKLYFKEIGKVPLLSAEQEVDLSKRIEAGMFAEHILDSGAELTPEYKRELQALVGEYKAAKQQMVSANLRLAVSIAKRYTGRGLLMLDLVQEGSLGIMRAVEKFDYTKGYKFSTYATWWVRQTITRAIADQGSPLRLPVHVQEDYNQLTRQARKLLSSLGREPTDNELADELDFTVEKIQELRRIKQTVMSLETIVGDSENSELMDFIKDPNAVDPLEQIIEDDERLRGKRTSQEVGRILDSLPKRKAQVIKLRFGLIDGRTHTLAEIGKKLGLTREGVRLIVMDVKEQLTHGKVSRQLKDLWEESA
jgi:RNA polymerase primary sigma factor